MTQLPPLRPPSQAIRWLVSEHLAVAITATLVAISLLKVLFVSAFDVNTAFLVLSLTDRVQLLMASAVSLFSLAIVMAVMHRGLRKKLFKGNDADATFGQQVGTSLAMVLIVPGIVAAMATSTVAIMVALLVFEFVIFRRARKRGRVDEAGYLVLSAQAQSNLRWVVGLALAGLIALSLGQDWMPREQITTSSGDKQVGRVIGVQADMMALLVRREGIRWIEVRDVETRQLCDASGGWWNESLLEIVFDVHDYVGCSLATTEPGKDVRHPDGSSS